MSEVIEDKKYDVIVTAAGEISGYTPEQALAMIPRIQDVVNTAMCNTFSSTSDFGVEVMVEPQRPEPTPEQRAVVEAYANKLDEVSKVHLAAEWAAKHATIHARDYALAEKWAAKSDISNRERCHGLVWDIRHQEDKVAQELHDKEVARNAASGRELDAFITSARTPYPSAPGYSVLYDSQNVQEIKDGLMKSAADLFS